MDSAASLTVAPSWSIATAFSLRALVAARLRSTERPSEAGVNVVMESLGFSFKGVEVADVSVIFTRGVRTPEMNGRKERLFPNRSLAIGTGGETLGP